MKFRSEEKNSSSQPMQMMQISKTEGYENHIMVTFDITGKQAKETTDQYQKRLKLAANEVGAFVNDHGHKITILALQGIPDDLTDSRIFLETLKEKTKDTEIVKNQQLQSFISRSALPIVPVDEPSIGACLTFVNNNFAECKSLKRTSLNLPDDYIAGQDDEIAGYDIILKNSKKLDTNAVVRFINVNFTEKNKDRLKTKLKHLTDSTSGQVIIAGQLNQTTAVLGGDTTRNFQSDKTSGFHFKEDPANYSVESRVAAKKTEKPKSDTPPTPETPKTELESDSLGPVQVSKLLSIFPNADYEFKKGGVCTITHKKRNESITIEKTTDRLKITANNSSEANLEDQMKAAAVCFPKDAVININVTGGDTGAPDYEKKIEKAKQQAWVKAINAGFKVHLYQPDQTFIDEQIKIGVLKAHPAPTQAGPKP